MLSAMCAAIQARESGLLCNIQNELQLCDITSRVQNNQIVKLSIIIYCMYECNA